jgi:hypothetical protein
MTAITTTSTGAATSVATKPRAYSYTRWSTPEQSLGDSARRQIELAKRYAGKHGLVLDDTLRLSDEGVSGFRGPTLGVGLWAGSSRRWMTGTFHRAPTSWSRAWTA